MLYENIELFKDSNFKEKIVGTYDVDVIGEITFGNTAKARIIPRDFFLKLHNTKSKLAKISCFSVCDKTKFVTMIANKQKVYFKL
jgi:hypothetical protein